MLSIFRHIKNTSYLHSSTWVVIWCIQSSAVITWSNLSQFYTQHSTDSSRTWIRLGTNNRNPIAHPNGWTRVCVLWVEEIRENLPHYNNIVVHIHWSGWHGPVSTTDKASHRKIFQCLEPWDWALKCLFSFEIGQVAKNVEISAKCLGDWEPLHTDLGPLRLCKISRKNTLSNN